MTVSEAERSARAALTRLGEPCTPALSAMVARHGPVAAVEALCSGDLPPGCAGLRPLGQRLADGATERDLATAARIGARFVCPGDDEWCAAVDDLAERRPWGLWVRGPLRLRAACDRAVAVVGARASTPYGDHVASGLGADLADRGWTVISGAAYGIDGAAHRGALAVEGQTVAVLACGVDVPYPRGHESLLDRIAREGLVVSEWAPGCAPLRTRFLTRNRVIAALGAGTVVVEAAARSGSLTTAREAASLLRHVMAVPGPVTSALSVGCHRLLRGTTGAGPATCVTGAAEVLELVGRMGDDAAPEPRGPETARDHLAPEQRRVLELVPKRRAVGPARIARAAGVDVVTVQRCLGALLAVGLVERTEEGWRLAAAGGAAP